MNTFKTGGIDKDFETGTGFRQLFDQGRAQLEADITLAPFLKVIAAHRGFHQVEHAPVYEIVVQRFDTVQSVVDFFDYGEVRVAFIFRRIEFFEKTLHQQQGDFGISVQRLGDIFTAVWKTNLLQVGGVSAHDLDIPCSHAGAEKQLVKGVIFTFLIPDRFKHLTEKQWDSVGIDGAKVATTFEGIVQDPVSAIAQPDAIGTTNQDLQSHGFKNRHGMR